MQRGLVYSREFLRNFCIIAHIDHGKSTLADRFLELAGYKISGAQFLDKLEVERKRGITVKAQSVSMDYQYQGQDYLLNLIDTPGHVDFSYEVSRSLRACQAAILLVDGTKGIQAQTYSTFFSALDANLMIIPAVNKIDDPAAQIQDVANQMRRQFDVEEISFISAKTGVGVQELLERVIKQVPAPTGNNRAELKAFLFDSWYTEHLGVICMVKIIDGVLRKGDLITSMASGQIYTVVDLGLSRLKLESMPELSPGQVGYVTLGMRKCSEARIGDTFCRLGDTKVTALPGFKESKPMVYAGVFPVDSDELANLQKAIDKYLLQDRSITVIRDSSEALGSGFRCGFLGMLHMDIFRQRLIQEYGIEILLTAPSVPYRIELTDDSVLELDTPSLMPDPYKIKRYLEPICDLTIVAPTDYVSYILNFCMSSRGVQREVITAEMGRSVLRFEIPMSELILDFYDKLKSMTKGHGTMDYEFKCYQESDLGLLTVMLNKAKVDPLTMLIHKSKGYPVGKSLAEKLKELLPSQQFEVAIQVAFNNRIIARSTIKSIRKDVTAKCYGGDQSRKRKLLERQKEGKKKMRMIGSVRVNPDTFTKVLKIK